MTVKIFPPQTIYETGKRENQEDAVWPRLGKATADDRLFIVCDGMGGHEHGEVASQTVCATIADFFRDHWQKDAMVDDQMITDAITAAFEALDTKDDGAVRKMGTTLTLVVLHRGGCTAAHIGDSRIYHIRPAKKQLLFRSRDHSLVFDLFLAGDISFEEMSNSPKKNIITKAMQPGEERRVRPDIVHIGDLQAGDYLYLCSDGMLEKMSDRQLLDIFGHGWSDERIRERLIAETAENSDNHSAQLIRIKEVKYDKDEAVIDDERTTKANVVNIFPEIVDAIEVDGYKKNNKKRVTDARSNKPMTPLKWLCLVLAAIAFFVLLAFLAIACDKKDKQQTSSAKIEIRHGGVDKK